jgi:L-malate glycosyltransferase
MVGGAESQMTQVAIRLHNRGHELTVGCMRAEGPLLLNLCNAGVPVVEFRVKKRLASLHGITQIWRLAEYLRSNKFEVIHTQDLWSNMMGVLAGWIAKVPFIASVRYDLSILPWYTPTRKWILRKIQERSSVVIANSEGVRDHLLEKEGFHPRLLTVIYNGVDCDVAPRAIVFRSNVFPEYGAEQIVIAVTANMNYAFKGHDVLIEAAIPVCKAAPNARFVLLGDGGRRETLQRRVLEVGLHDQILFLGSRQDVVHVLQACDIGVLPSLTEGLPNAMLEYMAVGLAVVGTRVGGIPELIEHNINGVLVPPGDAKSLCDALLTLIQNQGLRENLGVRARETAVQRFSYQRLIAQLEQLYRVACSDPAGRS